MVLPPILPMAFPSPHVGDARDQGGEHQRRDDHLDQAQEDVGDQREIPCRILELHRIVDCVVAQGADEDAEHHADQG